MQNRWKFLLNTFFAISILLAAWQPVKNSIVQISIRKPLEIIVAEILQEQKVAYSISIPIPCILDPIESEVQLARLHSVLLAYQNEPVIGSSGAGHYRFAGFAYCMAGDFERAVVELQQARELEPLDSISSLQLISLYIRRGDIHSARNVLHSGSVTALQLVGVTDVLMKSVELQEAHVWCRLALELNPLEKKAWSDWINIGGAFERQQDWIKALEVYRSGLNYQEELGVKVYRGSFSSRIGVNILRTEGISNHPEALALYNRAIDDGDFVAEWDRANAFMNRGNWYRASRPEYAPDVYLQDYQNAFKIYPKSDWAALMIGIVYYQDLKDLDQAEKYLRMALSISDKNPNNFYHLAVVLEQKGDLESAIDLYTGALALKPDFQGALDRLNQAKAKREGSP